MLIDAARRGELPSLDGLDDNDDQWNEMIEWLETHDEKINESADALSHRINNLLMAVQTTCDYLALKPDVDGIERLRERMVATVKSGKSALEDVRAVLFSLR